MARLKAPFPYYGGKSRIADEVWRRYGPVERYIEPFGGSFAVLLANPHPANMEIVCDTNGFVCNFYRAVRSDPDKAAHYADYPTIHQDLTARHRWLKQWGMEHSQQLSEDPEYYDCKVAGWWVWGMSLWIGGEWCDLNQKGNIESRPTEKAQGINNTAGRPFVGNKGESGRGVSAQVADKSPKVMIKSGGNGVSAQRDQIPQIHEWSVGSGVSKQAMTDKRPIVKPSGAGGGVSMQNISDKRPHVDIKSSGEGVSKQVKSRRLSEWFNDLATRLERVVILNRDWTSAVTPTILANTPSSPNKVRAIFLDPPYRTEDRGSNIYQSDTDGTSDDTAVKAYEWAVKHGNKEDFKIAYCCHKDDFEVPEGWSFIESSFGGIRNEDRKHKRDVVMFSPHCHREDLLI